MRNISRYYHRYWTLIRLSRLRYPIRRKWFSRKRSLKRIWISTRSCWGRLISIWVSWRRVMRVRMIWITLRSCRRRSSTLSISYEPSSYGTRISSKSAHRQPSAYPPTPQHKKWTRKSHDLPARRISHDHKEAVKRVSLMYMILSL